MILEATILDKEKLKERVMERRSWVLLWYIVPKACPMSNLIESPKSSPENTVFPNPTIGFHNCRKPVPEGKPFLHAKLVLTHVQKKSSPTVIIDLWLLS